MNMAHILVIDDEEPIQEVLRQTLEYAGYEVTIAANGIEGLQAFRENPADIIIVDMIMPKKDGIETIMDLKMEAPNAKIIAISGGGAIGPKDYLEIAEGIGASHILPKPITRDDLLQTIRTLLD
jgi:CheY-like chemotaxis protein